jgi:high-affinity iron transporter
MTTPVPARLAIVGVVLATLSLAPPLAAGELDGRELVHLVGYVAADYPGAVSNGEVTNEAEYAEQLRVLDAAVRLAERIDPALVAEVVHLREAVADKKAETEIAAGARALERRVVAQLHLDLGYSACASSVGGHLYAELCVACHGPRGRGDGPKARDLVPPPLSFQDPAALEVLSPVRVASTVRFGVLGTAMPGFPGLTDDQIAHLGCWVMTLRHTPRRAPRTPTMTSAELYARTDGDVLDELFAAGAAEHELGSMLADLRTRAAFEAAPTTPAGWVRRDLFLADRELLFGNRDPARASVRSAQRDLVALRPAVDVVDGALALEIDERMLALRERMRFDEEEALARDLAILRRLVARAELRLAGAPPPGDPIHGVPFEPPAPRPLDAAWLGAVAAWRHALAAAVAFLALALGWRTSKSTGSLALAALAVGSLAILPSLLGSWGGPARSLVDAGAELHRLRGAAAVAGLAIGAALLVAATIGAAAAVRRSSPSARDRLTAVAAVAAVAMQAGRAAWALQVADSLPSHVLGWAGMPALGLHPTVEACAAQIIAALAVTVAFVARHRLSAAERTGTVGA